VARLRALGWQDDWFVWFAGCFVVAIPWVEEWWWRGQALPRCGRAFGPRAGLAVAAIAFTGYHGVVLSQLYPWGPVLIRLAAILPVAFWWCLSARRHRSWLGPWLAHGPGADLAMVLLFAWLHRHP
jgi:membrane protease YdiL (CAAX protease family)